MDRSSWPTVSKSEIKIVNQVLHSNDLNYWTGKTALILKKILVNYSISNILFHWQMDL